jgi:plastocyanin
MMRATALALAAAALATAGPAAADTIQVNALFQEFAPSQVDALPGDAVVFANISERTHTVTADDGSFDSGELPGGASFGITAGVPGAYAYHCTIHPSMTGEVDVRRLILGVLPTAATPAGERVAVKGRTANPDAPVTIERDIGSGFRSVATATPAPDGFWSTEVTAETTGDYRAVSGLDVSQARRLIVIDRHVVVTPTSRGVHVTVVPGLPYGRVLLERNTRERFGWFPVARRRLDYASRADFRVARPVTVRVAIADRDGWTHLAVSPPLHLRAARR